ncbi:MAG: acyl-CoA thioesterase [Blautia sp.]|nr:acyl-CoA thioesterase [Blautia sp.]
MSSEPKTPVIFRVRPDEVDPYHIAHHSRYAVWAEEALLRWMEEAGEAGPYRVTDFQCKYISSALLYEELAVMLRRKSVKDGIHEFSFSMRKTKGQQVLCTGLIAVSK